MNPTMKVNDSLTLDGANTEPSNVTRFRISPENLGRWMHQNEAQYTGAFVDGCLLDNFVFVCKRGFAAVYEHYLNCWSSDYRSEFEAGAAQNVWKNWYEFEEGCEKDGG